MCRDNDVNTSILLDNVAAVFVCEVSDKLHKIQGEYDDSARDGCHWSSDKRTANMNQV